MGINLGAITSKGRDILTGLPVVGSLAESFVGSPEADAQKKAFEDAKKAYETYRPYNMQARMAAFQNMANAFGPMQNLMSQMYGTGAVPDMAKMVQNPFPEAMQKGMYENAFGPGGNAQNPFASNLDKTIAGFQKR